ncbi:MAG: hypothetical protein JWO49_2258 [Arthrobacter sp.]|nr:hypothetical protein [Arthrobacter sp.]
MQRGSRARRFGCPAAPLETLGGGPLTTDGQPRGWSVTRGADCVSPAPSAAKNSPPSSAQVVRPAQVTYLKLSPLHGSSGDAGDHPSLIEEDEDGHESDLSTHKRQIRTRFPVSQPTSDANATCVVATHCFKTCRSRRSTLHQAELVVLIKRLTSRGFRGGPEGSA